MATVLITGVSGVGKSTLLRELAKRGHRVVETDEPGWCEPVPAGEPNVRWDEARITELLDGHRAGHLFLAGTVENQGRFYPRFDAVVLLTAPLEVILDRVVTRNDNPFGHSARDRELIAGHITDVEPLLRAGADHVLDGTTPVLELVSALEAIAAA